MDVAKVVRRLAVSGDWNERHRVYASWSLQIPRKHASSDSIGGFSRYPMTSMIRCRTRRIRPELLEELSHERTGLVFSAVSSWEIAIKWAVGRLALPEPLDTYVPQRMRQSKAAGLAVQHTHALQVAPMPRHHRDPFDRLLIAQSQIESVPIITADPAFDAYDVEVVKP